MSDRIQLGRQYQQDAGDEIPLFRTYPDGRRERITSFISQEEMLKAMSARDPKTGESLYEKSALFRRSIEEITANTEASTIGVQIERPSPIPTDDVFLQGLREDALRQQYAAMVDKAGGSDAISKYNLALMMTNPTEEQFENFSQIQGLTQVDDSKSHESWLKQRKADGLGPWRESVSIADDNAAYEQGKIDEALDWLASQDIGHDVVTGSEGVEV